MPSGQPQNVSAVVLNATAIQLYWSPPLEHEQNGIITSYTVVVFEVNSNNTIGSWSYSLKSNVIISNLHPYYEFRLLVGAATVIGLGPFYEVQVQTDQAGTFRYKYFSKNYYYLSQHLVLDHRMY